MYFRKILTTVKKLFAVVMVVLVIGFLVPQRVIMPVEGATKKSYSQNSFWAYPWGKSVTHKGVDIFAKRGTNIRPATFGIVLFKGVTPRGGNVVFILGPKWRIHYYAHLEKVKTKTLSIVSSKSIIGTVGNTGNAVGKSSHLHYTIKTVIPYPWRIDKSIQGKRKMFYLNPIKYLNECFS
jgi:peptidoglycan LD-endopeptidase LytH